MPVMEDVYPSRVANEPRLIARADPVVYREGARQGPLTSDQIRAYEETGCLVIESLLAPDDIERLNRSLQDVAAAPDVGRLEETIIEPGSGAVRSIFRIHALHEVYGRLACDERLLGAARQILGSEVYLHQSRVNLKPGFSGKEFYWHSDFETWHVEDGMPRMRALSVSVALTANYPFNGPLMLIPGSHMTYVACVGQTPADHYKASLRKQEYGVPDPASLRTLTDRGGIRAPTGPAGTAVFFDCNTMHGSNSNISPYPRSNVFFVYNSVENTLQAPFGGLAPRPEHIATRERVEPLAVLARHEHGAARRPIWRWLSLVWLAAASVSCGGQGDPALSTLERIRQAGIVRVGYANEAPYAYQETATGRLTGEAPQIARVVFERMGVEQVEGILTEFGSLIPGLQAGRFDLIAAGMYITPQRCEQIAFSNPTYSIGEAFIVEAGNPLDLHGYEDVRDSPGATIGVVSGAIERNYARAVGIPDGRILTFPDAPSALAGVRAGRVSAYAATELTVRNLLSKDPVGVEHADPFADPVIDGETVRGYGAFGFREQDARLLSEFNRHLADLIGTPEHLNLVEPFGFTQAQLPGDSTAEQLCREG